MEASRIPFESMEWQNAAPGLRFKVYRSGNKQMRLLEHSQEFVEPDWCMKAHSGLVLKGELEIDFHGRKVRFPEGSGLSIPPGEKHKGHPITSSVLLFLVEDI
jgi:quercetin dioxygenase-like cupin family protein